MNPLEPFGFKTSFRDIDKGLIPRKVSSNFSFGKYSLVTDFDLNEVISRLESALRSLPKQIQRFERTEETFIWKIFQSDEDMIDELNDVASCTTSVYLYTNTENKIIVQLIPSHGNRDVFEQNWTAIQGAF
jgi:hypothetical protein